MPGRDVSCHESAEEIIKAVSRPGTDPAHRDASRSAVQQWHSLVDATSGVVVSRGVDPHLCAECAVYRAFVRDFHEALTLLVVQRTFDADSAVDVVQQSDFRLAVRAVARVDATVAQ